MTSLKSYPYPNNLYIGWVKELKKDAQKENSKLQYTYSKALKSLKLYPLPLKSGKETIILKGIGNGLAEILDEKLNECLSTSSNCLSLNNTPKKNIKYGNKKLHLKKYQSLSVKHRNNDKRNIISLDAESNNYLCTQNFELILYIDSSENNQKFKKQAICHLNQSHIKFEIKRLSLGDFLWVAQDINDRSKPPLVLPYIIERKKAEDLSHSIKDGRFREQKYRLNKYAFISPIYLVEGLDSINYRGLPIDTLKQAITNTMIIDKFHIIYSSNLANSVDLLILFHKKVLKTFTNMSLKECDMPELLNYKNSSFIHSKEITLINFSKFNSLTSKNKNLTLRDIFAKQLLVFNGISMDKAHGILTKYPTYFDFSNALKKCATKEEKEKLLSEILNDKSKKLLSTKIIHELLLYYN